MRRFFISIIGALAVFSAGAAGETVPTTKSYVDSALTQKQNKISSMPAGYTRLAYIESTGTQWIDTGVVADNTTEAEVDFMDFVGSSYLFFTTNGGWGSRNFGIIINDYLRFYMNCDGRTTYTRPSGTNVSGNIKLLTTGIFLNDTQLSINSGQIPSSTAFTTTYPIVLFGGNYAGTPSAAATVKIRYFKLWKNHELVRNFIPARRDSDNVVGMYDTISGQFFTNSGTGEFIAGPVGGAGAGPVIPGNQVLTNTGTAGEYGTKGIYDANGGYATQAQNLIDAATMNAGVQNAINSEFQCIEWDEHGECLLLDIGSAAMFSSGYTALEYIESTGTQWINTSVIPDTNIRIVTSFVMPANPRTNFGWVLGSRTSDFSIGIHVYPDYVANQIRFDFKSKFTAFCSATESLVNKAVVVDFNDNFNAFVYDENNNLLCSTSLGNPGNAQSTEPLAIFGFPANGNLLLLPIKIFYVRIYNGPMLVRNFIPARRNSDGVLGMYDTVSNTLFTNAGTGEFIAGPVVYLPQGD